MEFNKRTHRLPPPLNLYLCSPPHDKFSNNIIFLSLLILYSYSSSSYFYCLKTTCTPPPPLDHPHSPTILSQSVSFPQYLVLFPVISPSSVPLKLYSSTSPLFNVRHNMYIFIPFIPILFLLILLLFSRPSLLPVVLKLPSVPSSLWIVPPPPLRIILLNIIISSSRSLLPLPPHTNGR